MTFKQQLASNGVLRDYYLSSFSVKDLSEKYNLTQPEIQEIIDTDPILKTANAIREWAEMNWGVVSDEQFKRLIRIFR